MDSNLLIKYIEQNNYADGYDLGLLGESFTGFNEVFKELFEISQMKGDLIIKTTSISEGSIDVNNIIQVITTSAFHDVKEFLNFLQVADHSVYQKASVFFSTLGNGHKTINNFFNENQFDNAVITGLIVAFFPKMIAWAGKQKKALFTRDVEGNTLPEVYAKKLQQMITKGKYKKALKPLTENNVSQVQIAATKKTYYVISIDETNLGDYLPDEEKILPEFENGDVVNMAGEILALQSTRGETLRFKAYGVDPKYQLLIAHPADGTKTEDYINYYKKQVTIKAQIYRKSLYKKPEIIIEEIQTMQKELFEK